MRYALPRDLFLRQDLRWGPFKILYATICGVLTCPSLGRLICWVYRMDLTTGRHASEHYSHILRLNLQFSMINPSTLLFSCKAKFTHLFQQLLGLSIVCKVIPNWLQNLVDCPCKSRFQVACKQGGEEKAFILGQGLTPNHSQSLLKLWWCGTPCLVLSGRIVEIFACACHSNCCNAMFPQALIRAEHVCWMIIHHRGEEKRRRETAIIVVAVKHKEV